MGDLGAFVCIHQRLAKLRDERFEFCDFEAMIYFFDAQIGKIIAIHKLHRDGCDVVAFLNEIVDSHNMWMR